MSAIHSPDSSSSSVRPPIPSAVHRVAGLPASRWGGLITVAFLLAGVAAWGWLATHHLGPDPGSDLAPHSGAVGVHGASAQKNADDRKGSSEVGSGGTSEIVILATTAQAAAGISLSPAEIRPLRQHITVPGRLDYNARQRLDYASPVDGIVSRVFAQVRQKVVKGDSLAEVSSPEIGMARDEVRKREDNREIEKKATDWAIAIADNVEDLLGMLDSHPPVEQVEQEFKGRLLGVYREKIISGYSRLLYVEKISASTQQLSQGGVLSGRIVDERISNLEVAKANLLAACEEAKFLTQQDRNRAQAAVEQADRLVRISQEHLRMLVGSRLGDDSEVIVMSEESPSGIAGEKQAISSLILRTPFDGLVEDVFVVRGERVQAGQKLFVVADTATLWVRAQIHERQWTAVEVAVGQTIRVSAPGVDVHEATACVNHVGAIVESDSRSVPLVAELANDDAHYKPGMFVWVDLPQGKVREVLSVPVSAVMRHEGNAFVFVAEGDGRFRRYNIETGIESDDFIEVLRGLKPQQQVVSSGAFILKSELLLEGDEETAGAQSPPSAS